MSGVGTKDGNICLAELAVPMTATFFLGASGGLRDYTEKPKHINFTKKRFHGIIIVHIIDAMEPFEHNRHIKCRVSVLMKVYGK